MKRLNLYSEVRSCETSALFSCDVITYLEKTTDGLGSNTAVYLHNIAFPPVDSPCAPMITVLLIHVSKFKFSYSVRLL